MADLSAWSLGAWPSWSRRSHSNRRTEIGNMTNMSTKYVFGFVLVPRQRPPQGQIKIRIWICPCGGRCLGRRLSSTPRRQTWDVGEHDDHADERRTADPSGAPG